MSGFAGTGAMLRLALRRDRVLLPVWVAVFVLSAWSSAAATIDLYPDEASRRAAVAAVNDLPSLLAFYGRVWEPTLGALSMVKMTAMGTALLAVLAIVLVVRHTRGEEEAGRLELLGATVVGRRAPLAAALLLVTLAMAAIGSLTALSLMASGLPAAGSWAFGLGWMLTGLVFAAVAAVTAQVSATSRAATGAALVVLGAAYVVRAVGDVRGTAEATSAAGWFSPLGWMEQLRAFAGDRWWVLALMLAGAVVLAGAAFVLCDRRDLGAGLVPDRPGPARASARLSSPIGLAARLSRPLLVGWAVAYVLLGALLGSIAGDLGPFLSSPAMKDFIATLGGTGAIADAFLAMEFGFVAVFTAAFAVAVTLRLHSEEDSGHAELVLAGAVSRTRWLAAAVVVAVVGSVVLTVLAALATGAVTAARSGTWSDLWSVLGGMAVHLPAVWVLAGIVVLLVGLVPRAAPLAWAVLVGFLLLGELGPLLSLPGWALDLSPFSHVPRLPGAPMSWPPLLWLLLVAAGLLLAGWAGFRRRDVPA